jgi:TolA-binding protein
MFKSKISSMRYLIGIFTVCVLAFSACQSPEEKAVEKKKEDSLAKEASKKNYLDQIDSAEKVMRASKTYDQRLAVATLKAYNDFTVTFPHDSMTAEYLFRAADLAQGSRNFEQAAAYLEIILDQHKDYKKYPDACFVAAFVYDTYLEDVNHGGDRAKQLYQFLIDNYPNTSYAEQAKVLIKYIGVPDSVMINDIIKKGGK